MVAEDSAAFANADVDLACKIGQGKILAILLINIGKHSLQPLAVR